MSRKTPRLDDRYLDLRAQQYTDKSFLGGTRLSTRIGLFVVGGLIAMAAFAAMYVYVDGRLTAAVRDWRVAEEAATLVGEARAGIEAVRRNEAAFLGNGDAGAAQAHEIAVNRLAGTLDMLQRLPGLADVRDHLATMRDGVEQYGEQFAEHVDNEQALGLTPGSGLRGQLRTAANDVRARLKAMGLGDLVARFDGLDAMAETTPPPAGQRTDLRRGYEGLIDAVRQSDGTDEEKSAVVDLIRIHRNVMDTLLDARVLLAAEPQRFDAILDYISPSLGAVDTYVDERLAAAPRALEAEQRLARQAVAGGSAAILGALVLLGFVLLRSIAVPVRRIAETAGRLTEGDRSVVVPVRGNSDSSGDIARALDSWLDNLAEIEHLRAELEDARMRLELSFDDGDEQVETAARINTEMPEGREEEPAPSDGAEALAGARETLPPPLPAGELAGVAGRLTSPIGDASQQLSRFSEVVTAAARDVERTEVLIRALSDTTRYMDDLEGCFESVRDELNLLVFRSIPQAGGSGTGGDSPVTLRSEQGEETAAGAPADEDEEARRFDAIRAAVRRGEGTLREIRSALDEVSQVARQIAATASAEAMEATHRLLSQSESLQSMLDDLVSNVSRIEDAGAAGNGTRSRSGDRDTGAGGGN